jgi:hypothetical protein
VDEKQQPPQQQGVVFPPHVVQAVIAGIAKKMVFEDAEPLINALRSGQMVNINPNPPADK